MIFDYFVIACFNIGEELVVLNNFVVKPIFSIVLFFLSLTVFHSVFSVKVAGSNNPSQGTTLQAKEPTLKIWTDNGNTIVYDEFYYEVIDKQVEELTKIILELFPNLDREYVENMIRINLEGYYGLRG